MSDNTRNESVSVAAASVEVARMGDSKANPRTAIVIRNRSDADADIITLNLGLDQAEANKGIVLKKDEAFADSSSEGYECYQGVITAICATANGVLSIFER
jgi:hypothetical protein